MACFYCARAQVNSPDAGPCDKCSNHVCTNGISARAHRYHGDTCACGCGKLICIYHMDEHARKKHQSTIQACFANTALTVSLVAAASLEDIVGAKPGSPRIGGALNDVREFLTVVNPPLAEGEPLNALSETALSALISKQAVPDKAGVHYALDLAPMIPAVFDSIQKSWAQLGNKGRSSYKGELRERLDSLASVPMVLMGLDSPDALVAYAKLSPRLHKIMRDYAIPHLTEGPEFMASLGASDLEQASRQIQRTSRGVHLPSIPLRGKF